MVPDPQQAYQFVVMLNSGLPASDAIQYFIDPASPLSPNQLAVMLQAWVGSRAVKKAQVEWDGQSWEQMTVAERMQKAIDKHYSELAYYLKAHNYSELTGPDKQKADTCRIALETKIAGLAGKTDALSRFFEDFSKSMKMPLGSPKTAT